MEALLIFDCDGTLVDSEGLVARVEAACLGEAGFPVSADAMEREFTGVSDADTYAILEERFGRRLPRGHADRVRRRVRSAFAGGLRPIPGIEGALRDLAAFPRCVASNSGLDRVVHALEVAGLGTWFGASVFSADQVGRGKPAPDLFLHAAERMGWSVGRCVVVEDSVAGVRAAVAAGMPAVGFAPSGAARAAALAAAGAAATVADMGALPGAVRRLAAASPRAGAG